MNLSAIPENSLAGVLEARSQEKMSSLCDRCYAPGACCREMGLHSHDLRIPRGDTEHYMLISSERKANILMDVLNLPFRFKENKSRGGQCLFVLGFNLMGGAGIMKIVQMFVGFLSLPAIFYVFIIEVRKLVKILGMPGGANCHE
jgi:hypothetical protein